MPKLRYIGASHHRIIEPEDFTKHGLSDGVSIDVWQGDLTPDLPEDVSEWLLSDYSTEKADWEEVSNKKAKESKKEAAESQSAAQS